MEHDAAHSRARTREAFSISAVIHLLIFLWLALNRAGAADTAGLTEITFVQETDPNGLPDAAPPMAQKTESSAPVQQVSTKATREAEPEHFQRALERASNAPHPQSTRALTDILDKHLDAIDKNGGSTTRIASLVPAPNVGIPAPAGLPGAGDTPNAMPATLSRNAVPGGGGGTAPIALKRIDSQPTARPVMAAAVIDAPASAPAPATHGGGSRNLAGANLVGPVADRAVTHYKVPDYPDWAKRDGTEGSVTLYFFVLPDGHVKENVLVERTSGFSDFDNRAVAALLQWQFVALPLTNEQWGRITFNYRLSDAQ
jgi:TonB family protein